MVPVLTIRSEIVQEMTKATVGPMEEPASHFILVQIVAIKKKAMLILQPSMLNKVVVLVIAIDREGAIIK